MHQGLIYFPNIEDSNISTLAGAISASGMEIFYAGKTTHPKKWADSDQTLEELLLEDRYTILENKASDLTFEIDLFKESQSEFSTIKITSQSEGAVVEIAALFYTELSGYVNSINMQPVTISRECPSYLEEMVKNA